MVIVGAGIVGASVAHAIPHAYRPERFDDGNEYTLNLAAVLRRRRGSYSSMPEAG